MFIWGRRTWCGRFIRYDCDSYLPLIASVIKTSAVFQHRVHRFCYRLARIGSDPRLLAEPTKQEHLSGRARDSDVHQLVCRVGLIKKKTTQASNHTIIYSIEFYYTRLANKLANNMFFDRNQDGNCWDSANEALSLEQSDWDYSPRTFETMYIIYLLLIVSGVLQKLIDCLSKGKYTDALKKYSFKQISWLHGLVTFSIMSIVQPNNLRSLAASLGITGDVGISAMKFSLQSVLAFILWDLLIKQPYAGKMIVAINWYVHVLESIRAKSVELSRPKP